MEAAKASVLSPLPSHLRPCLATASLGADLTFDDVRLVMCLNFAVWIVHQHYREVDRSELVRGKVVRAVLDLYTEKSLATGCKKRKARASPPLRGGDAACLRFMPSSAVFLQFGFRHPCPGVLCSFQPSAASLLLYVRFGE